jgi:hypothetical protein
MLLKAVTTLANGLRMLNEFSIDNNQNDLLTFLPTSGMGYSAEFFIEI